MMRRSRGRGVRFSAVSRVSVKSSGWRVIAAKVAPYVAVLGLALLVVAAARPREPFGKSSRSVESIAIAMVVDVSGSMRAPDMSSRYSREVTRLDVVKKAFAEFVKKRPDDLISLVTFGTYASARTPLTSDHETLLNVFEPLTIDPLHPFLISHGNLSGLIRKRARLDALAIVMRRIIKARCTLITKYTRMFFEKGTSLWQNN
jgi:Ca-activated chloride channel family protein